MVTITLTSTEGMLWHRSSRDSAKARVQWKRIANSIARRGAPAAIRNASRVLYEVVPSSEGKGFKVTRNMSPEPWNKSR